MNWDWLKDGVTIDIRGRDTNFPKKVLGFGQQKFVELTVLKKWRQGASLRTGSTSLAGACGFGTALKGGTLLLAAIQRETLAV